MVWDRHTGWVLKVGSTPILTPSMLLPAFASLQLSLYCTASHLSLCHNKDSSAAKPLTVCDMELD